MVAMPLLDQSVGMLHETLTASPLTPLDSARVLPMEPVQPEQPKSLTPRDINAHLARTLAQYDALTTQFAQNKLAIDAKLEALRLAGGEASVEMERLQAALSDHITALQAQASSSARAMEDLTSEVLSDLAQSRSLGQAQLQALGSRLDADVERLQQGVIAIDELLATQNAIVRAQTVRLNQFDVAVELLDTATRGNRSRIEAVRDETLRQHSIALAQLAGLDALQRGQSTELAELRQTTVVLQTESQRLEGAIHAVAHDLQSHTTATRRSFQRTHIALAAGLLVALSGFALVKWVPAFAPVSSDAGLASAQQHLQTLDAQVAAMPALQAATVAEQNSKLGALADSLIALERRLAVVQSSVRALRAKAPGVAGQPLTLPPLADREWLVQQDVASLTVQLAGLPNEQALNAFLEQHASALSGKELALTVTQPVQGTRYNVFYGVFNSRDDARAAIAALPMELRSNRPWVRTMGDVQGTLK